MGVLLHTGIQPVPRLLKIYSVSAWYLLCAGNMTRRNTQGKHINVTFSKYTKCTKHSEENPNKIQTVKTHLHSDADTVFYAHVRSNDSEVLSVHSVRLFLCTRATATRKGYGKPGFNL